MQKAIPIPLAGTSSRHSLPRISSFEKWDRQYDRQGIQLEISQGVDQEVSKTIGWLIRPMSPRHQDALAVVFTALTMDVRNHWLAIANFLTSQRTICLRQCEDAEEAWKFPCEVIKAVFVAALGSEYGSMRPSLKKFSIYDAAEMMWGILPCHKLMNKFVSHKFLGHPKLLIFSLNHLSCLKVSLKDLHPMKQQADQLQMEMGAMLEELDKKEDKLGDNDVVQVYLEFADHAGGIKKI
ncbi:unnamed protein product [Cylindrotheca closterium]|uniref:Uncharacterized protein n=1 Tax=Cylindrotheca closterium TaxID=2856 RepID=A0AAD2FTS9_9STRA|nr:unnamed protein product [Cylindrotheca closterium]